MNTEQYQPQSVQYFNIKQPAYLHAYPQVYPQVAVENQFAQQAAPQYQPQPEVAQPPAFQLPPTTVPQPTSRCQGLKSFLSRFCCSGNQCDAEPQTKLQRKIMKLYLLTVILLLVLPIAAIIFAPRHGHEMRFGGQKHQPSHGAEHPASFFAMTGQQQETPEKPQPEQPQQPSTPKKQPDHPSHSLPQKPPREHHSNGQTVVLVGTSILISLITNILGLYVMAKKHFVGITMQFGMAILNLVQHSVLFIGATLMTFVSLIFAPLLMKIAGFFLFSMYLTLFISEIVAIALTRQYIKNAEAAQQF